MEAYNTVYSGGSGEIVEKKSRFIADVFPVTSEDEAMEYLEEIRKRYWDARHHCTDVLVVVTRYFGGTLLGTGGLVRAYTASAAEGLKHSEIITRFHGFKLKISADYTALGKIQYLLAQKKISILESVYTDRVELTALVPDEEERELYKEIMDGTNGQAELYKEMECWFAQTGEGLKVFEDQAKGK